MEHRSLKEDHEETMSKRVETTIYKIEAPHSPGKFTRILKAPRGHEIKNIKDIGKELAIKANVYYVRLTVGKKGEWLHYQDLEDAFYAKDKVRRKR